MSKAKQEWPANEITKTEADKKRNTDRGFWLNRRGVLPCLIILEILAIVYDAFVNDSRIIRPVDFSTYSFRLSDLPLIVMTAVFVVYVFYMVIRMLVYQWKNRGSNDTGMTRKLNPRFGWFGFAGFFGFMGIPAYMLQQQVWPFFFFVFFGFFGFFYE